MHKEEILALLRPALSQRSYFPSDAASATPAAVLVIIHYQDDNPHLFLTKRSSGLKSHKGEISFPGGRYSRDDRTLLATALRETQEEIGIAFTQEQVAGSLRAVRTMTSNHFVVPFITVQDSLPKYKPAASEVDAVIDVPLIQILKTIQPDAEHYRLSKGAFKFTHEGNVIWGATARIMEQLHNVLIGS